MSVSVTMPGRHGWPRPGAQRAGVPVEASVAAILRPTWPLLPMPITATRPWRARMRATACAKASPGGAPARSKRALPRPGLGGPWRWRGRGQRGGGDCSGHQASVDNALHVSLLPVSLPTRRALIALAICFVLLLAWDASGLDMAVMLAVGSPSGFALREAWVTKQLIHEGGRLVSYAAMLLIVAANLTPRVLPALTRRERTVVDRDPGQPRLHLAAQARQPLQLPVGLASLWWHGRVRVALALRRARWRPGHCFPSGHASAAFAYLAGGWAWRAPTHAPHGPGSWRWCCSARCTAWASCCAARTTPATPCGPAGSAGP